MPNHPEVKEAIGLCVAFEALRDLVNHCFLDFRELADSPGQAEVVFKSTPHRDLFYIRLLDFTHEKGSKDLLGEPLSCLDVIERASANPRLSDPGPAQELAEAASSLRRWLDQVIHPKVWLGSVSINVRLSVTRIGLLRIVGNQAKHNAARLTSVCKQVQMLLDQQGNSLPLEQIPFVLDDLREQLGENIFIYYGSWLAELTNNLSWALYRYVEPVYRQHIVYVDGQLPGMYRFRPLPGVAPESLEHQWFHRLLNEARQMPYVQPFTAPHYLKTKSSLEWEDSGTA